MTMTYMKYSEDMPNGYYVICNSEESRKSIVYLYDLPEFNGVRHIAFMPHDGAALMPVWDLRDDSRFIPICITAASVAATNADLDAIGLEEAEL